MRLARPTAHCIGWTFCLLLLNVPQAPGQDLPTAKPEHVGVSSEKIEELAIHYLTVQLLCAEPASNTSSPPIQPFTHSRDLFPVLPWDVLHGWKPPHRNPKHGLKSIAECNFSLAGFVKPEDLPLCEKLGLAAIMAPSVSDKPWFGRWREMSGEEIDRAVKGTVKATGDSPLLLGGDEIGNGA